MLKRFRCLLALAIFAAFFTPGPRAVKAEPQQQPPALGQPDIRRDFTGLSKHRVKRVLEGGAFAVERDGKEVTIRFVGVTTLQRVAPGAPNPEDVRRASEFLSDLLLGEEVYLEESEVPTKTQKDGPQQFYVYRAPDGLFVNLEILRQGYGQTLTDPPFRHQNRFQATERQAKEANKGLWTKDKDQPAKAPKATAPAPPAAETPKRVEQPPKQEDSQSITVYVTKTGAKYHVGSCRYLSKSKIPVNLKDAKARYSACSVCRPPT